METIRIFHCDPEAHWCRFVESVLPQQGRKIDLVSFNDLDLAIRALTNPPDALAPDVFIFEPKGFSEDLEFIRKMREAPGHAETPIMAFTHWIHDHERARLLEAGVKQVVTKPGDKKKLQDALVVVYGR